MPNKIKLKLFKVSYTAYLTRVIEAPNKKWAFERFQDDTSSGDYETEGGECRELKTDLEIDAAKRHYKFARW